MWEAMPAEEFVKMASDPHVLGDPSLKTQHFIGGTRWEKVSYTDAIGYHQLRVPHQKYTDASCKEVFVKGHAHSFNKHWYKKIDGVWKFAGLAPEIRWFEYDFDKVFQSGRDNFGEKEQLDEVKAASGIPSEIPVDHEDKPNQTKEARNGIEELPAIQKAQLDELKTDSATSIEASIEALVSDKEPLDGMKATDGVPNGVSVMA
jgi:scytalone dehydratase